MEKVLKWTMPIIQTVITSAFMIMLITSGLLPGKYIGMAAGAVAAALLITMLFACTKSGAVRTVGNVLAIFVCGMLVFAMVYVNQIMKTLNSVAGSDTEVKIIAVIVKTDNVASSIEETTGYRFGVYEGADGEQIAETIEDVKQANAGAELTDDAKATAEAGDADLIIENFDSLLELAQSLLDGEIDAAICNKAYTEILGEVIADFSTDSRIIYEKEGI